MLLAWKAQGIITLAVYILGFPASAWQRTSPCHFAGGARSITFEERGDPGSFKLRCEGGKKIW
jgi:hypothetical protein